MPATFLETGDILVNKSNILDYIAVDAIKNKEIDIFLSSDKNYVKSKSRQEDTE